MKILKKLLPVLLAAVLLTGAFAAFSACAPIEPNIPPEEEEPGGGQGDQIGYWLLPQEFVFRGVRYTISSELRYDDIVMTEEVIGMCVREDDYERYREEYPDMEFWVDTENKMFNHRSGDKFYICVVENYPIEQCVILRDDRQVCGIFSSDLLVVEEKA